MSASDPSDPSDPSDLREFWDEERAENEAAWHKGAIKSLTSSASATAKAQRELAAMRERAEKAEAEVERLHSWDGLMELLDEHWPEDVYPTLPDSDERDPGPRIVSLLRVQDQPQRDSTLDAMVERSHPDDVSQRAELDSRTIGFTHRPQEGRS